MTKQGGLGRGLSSLIPVAAPVTGLRDIPISSIEPNRYQPRREFEEDSLASLAASIREVGVLQPILVRPAAEGFELIAGERRWRAARRAGLAMIPAIVQESDDVASLQTAIVENLHRQDLNVFEEAAAFQQLIEEFHLTHEEVGTRVGKSRAVVSNTLRMLQLPARVQRLVIEGAVSPGHARALLGSSDRTFQMEFADRIVREGLTVRETEEAVRRRTETPSDEPARARGSVVPPKRPAVVVELENLLSDTLMTAVTIEVLKSEGGKVVIAFGDLNDLHRIATAILDPAR